MEKILVYVFACFLLCNLITAQENVRLDQNQFNELVDTIRNQTTILSQIADGVPVRPYIPIVDYTTFLEIVQTALDCQLTNVMTEQDDITFEFFSMTATCPIVQSAGIEFDYDSVYLDDVNFMIPLSGIYPKFPSDRILKGYVEAIVRVISDLASYTNVKWIFTFSNDYSFTLTNTKVNYFVASVMSEQSNYIQEAIQTTAFTQVDWSQPPYCSTVGTLTYDFSNLFVSSASCLGDGFCNTDLRLTSCTGLADSAWTGDEIRASHYFDAINEIPYTRNVLGVQGFSYDYTATFADCDTQEPIDHSVRVPMLNITYWFMDEDYQVYQRTYQFHTAFPFFDGSEFIPKGGDITQVRTNYSYASPPSGKPLVLFWIMATSPIGSKDPNILVPSQAEWRFGPSPFRWGSFYTCRAPDGSICGNLDWRTTINTMASDYDYGVWTYMRELVESFNQTQVLTEPPHWIHGLLHLGTAQFDIAQPMQEFTVNPAVCPIDVVYQPVTLNIANDMSMFPLNSGQKASGYSVFSSGTKLQITAASPELNEVATFEQEQQTIQRELSFRKFSKLVNKHYKSYKKVISTIDEVLQIFEIGLLI